MNVSSRLAARCSSLQVASNKFLPMRSSSAVMVALPPLTKTSNRRRPFSSSSSSSPPFVGALDQGTSSTRFVVFDKKGQVVSSVQKEHQQFYPQPGWVQHDPNEIWDNSAQVMAETMEKAGIGPKDVASIGITNQRETTVVWDKTTGEPLHPAIVWNDSRTHEIVSEYQSRLGGADALREITGYVFHCFYLF